MSRVMMEERDYFLKAEQAYAAVEPAKLQSKEGPGQNDRELQAVDLFRRYFPEKSKQDNGGSTGIAEAELGIEKNRRRLPPRALIPLLQHNFMNSSMSRDLPPAGTRPGGDPTSPAAAPRIKSRSGKAQLTIFYAGSVHVYDDVSVDKAQAIMILAGDSCLSTPVKEIQDTDARLSLALHSSTSRPEEAGVPIARKISLQHFLQKRYQRMRERSPYAGAPSPDSSLSSRKEDQVGELSIRDLEMNKRESVSSSWLSPFPSQFGSLSSSAVSSKP